MSPLGLTDSNSNYTCDDTGGDTGVNTDDDTDDYTCDDE